MQDLINYPMTTRPTNKWGLLFEYSIEPTYSDTADWNPPVGACQPFETPFSTANRQVLQGYVEPWMRSIVEIGVSRDGYNESSTKILLDNKHPDCVYLGIDIEDRTFILDKGTNVNFLQHSSWDVEHNMSVFSQLGQPYIDLLFIDGDHSINAVLQEWDYAKYVNPNGGVIVLHDTNFHSGPWCLLKALDPNLFTINKYCVSYNDYGIAVLRRK